jgi:hypothetical protein
MNREIHRKVSELIKNFLNDLEKIEKRKGVFVSLEATNYEYQTIEYAGIEKKKVHKLDYTIELVR